MNPKAICMVIIMMLVSLTSYAQALRGETDSMRMEKYRAEIGLDMTVQDFGCRAIDAKAMGALFI